MTRLFSSLYNEKLYFVIWIQLIFIINLDNRRPITDDEPQLTDDEDSNGRDVAPIEEIPIEIEQQKKRRRTANYQNIISTTTNGNHEDERTSPPLSMFSDCLPFYQSFLLFFFSFNSFDKQCRIVIESSINR